MAAFEGLPKDFFAFFRELAANNDKAWFEENKPRYRESVLMPLCTFMEAMAPRVGRISKHVVVDPRPNGGSMFRIYRDVRFSKDKSPYKTNAGVHFRHALGRDAHAPGYTVIPCVKGVGWNGEWHSDEIAYAERMVMLSTITRAETLDGIVASLRPVMQRWRVVVSVADVQVLRSEKF